MNIFSAQAGSIFGAMLFANLSLPYPVRGLTTTSNGDLAIVDKEGKKVDIINSTTGTVLYNVDMAAAGGVGALFGIARRNKTLLLTDSSRDTLHIVSEDGPYITQLVLFIPSPQGVAVAGPYVFISSVGLNLLKRFVLDTDNQIKNSQTFFDSPQASLFSVPFTYPVAISVNKDSQKMAVAAFASNSVLVFNGTSYVNKYQGTDIISPSGVAVDSYGRLFISDSGNQRIILASTGGEFITTLVDSFPGYPMNLLLVGDKLYACGYNINFLPVYRLMYMF